jgi:hypothetical protein
MSPPKDLTNADLAKRIDSLEETVISLDKAIRGYNGELGVIGRLVLLERVMIPLSGLLEDYASLRSDVAILDNNFGGLSKSVTNHHAEQREEEIREKTRPRGEVLSPSQQAAADRKEFGTWSWFRDTYLDKIVLTVVTVVVTAIILYVLQIAVFKTP